MCSNSPNTYKIVLVSSYFLYYHFWDFSLQEVADTFGRTEKTKSVGSGTTLVCVRPLLSMRKRGSTSGCHWRAAKTMTVQMQSKNSVNPLGSKNACNPPGIRRSVPFPSLIAIIPRSIIAEWSSPFVSEMNVTVEKYKNHHQAWWVSCQN